MAKQSEQVLEEQIFFLKDQFWKATIAAAFARAKVYKENIEYKNIATEKLKFKRELFKIAENLIFTQYSIQEVSERQHIKNIFSFQIKNEVLVNSQLNFGVCQKLLNLYLKYLWCANYIKFEPPHFPLDRLIQIQKLNKVEANWTELNDSFEYERILNELYNSKEKAKWELIEYNKVLNKE